MLIVSAAVALPYLTTIFIEYNLDLDYISRAGDRAYAVQQSSEVTESMINVLRGWSPATDVGELQTDMADIGKQLRGVNEVIIDLATQLNGDWLAEASVDVTLFDGISARPKVSAPSVPLNQIRGKPLYMEQAVNATLVPAYLPVSRQVNMRVVDAVHLLADTVLQLSLTNFSAYGGLSGSARHTTWQKNVQRLLEVTENAGRTGRLAIRTLESVSHGRSFIETSAANVSAVSLVFMVILVSILVLLMILLYIPVMIRVEALRNRPVQRFLKIPINIVQLLHRQSLQRVKYFSRMEVCSTHDGRSFHIHC